MIAAARKSLVGATGLSAGQAPGLVPRTVCLWAQRPRSRPGRNQHQSSRSDCLQRARNRRCPAEGSERAFVEAIAVANSLELDDAAPQGDRDRFRAIAGSELVHHVLDVDLDRLLRDE